MKSLDDILKMASDMQAKVEEAQNSLDNIEVEGQSGGGMVKIRASAKGRVIGIDLDPSLLSTDSKEMLEDLIVAAFNDTRAKADQAAHAEMTKMTAGMPMPPGFKI